MKTPQAGWWVVGGGWWLVVVVELAQAVEWNIWATGGDMGSCGNRQVVANGRLGLVTRSECNPT